jgi:transcriptional regulator with XRE-family HTH domain
MKLINFLKSNKTSREDFALLIGVNTMALDRYLSGERIPRQTTMAKIVSITQGCVQPNDFYAEAIAALKKLPS